MLHKVIQSFGEKTIHQKIAVACSILMSVVFVIIILLRAVDYPTAGDDFKMYVIQFHEDFLNKSGFLNTIRYFFFPAFGFHTLLTIRLLSFFSYIFFGAINFKFLVIMGNLAYLFAGYKMSVIAAKSNKEPYMMPIILSILLIPLMGNFWTVFITQFSFIILFAFLCFYFMTEGKMGYMLLFFTIGVFTSGGGVFVGMVMLPGLLLYSIKEKKYIGYALLLIGLVALTMFFLFTFRPPMHASGESTIVFSFQAFMSYLIYMMVFAQNAITPLFFNYQSMPIVYVIIGILLLGTLLYLLIYKYQETTHSPFFYLCLYVLLLGLVAAIVREGGEQMFPPMSQRYQHYSVIFMASFIALIYSHIPSKYIRIGLGIFVALVFFMRFEQKTISKRVGYHYDFLTNKRTERLRKITRKKKYMSTHKVNYDALSQNASLTPYTYQKKPGKPNAYKPLKFMDEPEFGLISFTFNEKINRKNLRVILKNKNHAFSLIPILYRDNKYYAVVSKNGDIPKGDYEVKIHYEINGTEYERTLMREMEIYNHKKPKPKPLSPISKLKKSTIQTDASILSMNGNIVAKDKQPFRIIDQDITMRGIAIDKPRQSPAADVYIKIGKQYFEADYGKPSKRLAASMGPKYGKVGFVVSIPKDKIKKGNYEVSLYVVSGNKKEYYEQKNKVSIEIR